MPPFNLASLEGLDRLAHIEEYLSTNKSDSVARAQAATVARGIITETIPIGSFVPNSSLASQANAIATLAYLRVGDIVNNLTFYNVSAAASNVYLKGGIWNTAGTLLAGTSGNASTVFSTGNTSFVTSALTSAYQPTVDTLVYVGITASTAAGPRVLAGATPALNMFNRLGTGAFYSVTASVATSDASSVTWTPGTNGAPWVALS